MASLIQSVINARDHFTISHPAYATNKLAQLPCTSWYIHVSPISLEHESGFLDGLVAMEDGLVAMEDESIP